MKINKISNNSFGLRIADNMPEKMLKHFWGKKFSRTEVINAIAKIKKSTTDNYTLTFNDFALEEPVSITLRKDNHLPMNFALNFASFREEYNRWGRLLPAKKRIEAIKKPMEIANEIGKAVKKYTRSISK